ncbi:hypothetical protein BLA29_004946 [Euroglyphus maynei]|uniref:Uncharacterized protein n=1 Tax=Euroglyphus maynei TaxID=6958 RepID=A0A1Y3AX35_EURMA|nr:hypothetical protein BLA29_004946 [Euroglyphus maynei]
MQPIRIKNQNSTTSNKQGQLQMASLFVTLRNLNEMTNNSNGNGENDRKMPNLKVGAVNGFFSELTKRFTDWFSDLMRKFIQYFQSIMSKNRQKGTVPVSIFHCNNGNDVTTRKPEPFSSSSSSASFERNRDRRTVEQPIDLEQFTDNYTEMYRHPFRFVQLTDGSIQNIQLSELDSDPTIIQFKKFIARSFATQLDERKKSVIEESDLGTHYCHYQMEFDDNGNEPKQYPNRSSRLRRSSYPDYESQHIVSVMREFKSDDIIIKRRNNNQRPSLRSEEIFNDNPNKQEPVMNHMDFNVQEIQLIHDNMVVASGGYFQGFLPATKSTSRKNDDRSRRSIDKYDIIDKYIREHLDFSMQYSMVVSNKKKCFLFEHDDSQH